MSCIGSRVMAKAKKRSKSKPQPTQNATIPPRALRRRGFGICVQSTGFDTVIGRAYQMMDDPDAVVDGWFELSMNPARTTFIRGPGLFPYSSKRVPNGVSRMHCAVHCRPSLPALRTDAGWLPLGRSSVRILRTSLLTRRSQYANISYACDLAQGAEGVLGKTSRL
jgi:hypothetical protein